MGRLYQNGVLIFYDVVDILVKRADCVEPQTFGSLCKLKRKRTNSDNYVDSLSLCVLSDFIVKLALIRANLLHIS